MLTAGSATLPPPTSDYVVIRGRRLPLGECVDQKLFDRAYIARLRQDFLNAQPFPHLVVEGWFNPILLELVHEEFDLFDPKGWTTVSGNHELTMRSLPSSRYGPASEIYFGIVNSGWFLDLIAEIVGSEELLCDPKLYGGGLHETPAGGMFHVHRDFDRHVRHGLDNKMVFITYLNTRWQAAWGSALELWNTHEQVRTIQPEFGTSVVLVNGPTSYHGHPQPMTAPDGRTRRSVACYYYQNRHAAVERQKRISSIFLVVQRSRRLRRAARRWLPPVLFDAIKKLVE
jgi:hypothetical protein